LSEEIVELLDELPADNMTVKVLEALDAVVPGEWENIIGCDNTITAVTGAEDEETIGKIRDRAIELYNDENNGYQTAVSIYRNIDNADNAIAAAAMAEIISEKIPFLSFFGKITPKADTTQSIDLALKIVAELVAYAKLNGIPELNPEAFVAELTENYTGPSKMRMVGLVCLDGLAPLGPDFLQKVQDALDGEDEGGTLENNPIFSAVSGLIPGDDKLAFVRNAFGAVSGWMDGLVSSTGLTPESVFENIGGFIDFSDDALDVVAAFIDQTTTYYKHTGIQTVARKLIAQAAEEV